MVKSMIKSRKRKHSRPFLHSIKHTQRGGNYNPTSGIISPPAPGLSPQEIVKNFSTQNQAQNNLNKATAGGGKRKSRSKQRRSKQHKSRSKRKSRSKQRRSKSKSRSKQRRSKSRQRGGDSVCTSPNGCVIAPQFQNQTANSSIIKLISNQLQQNANAAGDSLK
jgi:hypothetical protein